MKNYCLLINLLLIFFSINLILFYFIFESSLLLIFYITIKWGCYTTIWLHTCIARTMLAQETDFATNDDKYYTKISNDNIPQEMRCKRKPKISPGFERNFYRSSGNLRALGSWPRNKNQALPWLVYHAVRIHQQDNVPRINPS